MLVHHLTGRGLGIPDDARYVIVFAESSHWDPNWLYTSEEYFTRFVAKNLDLALEELEKEPRRVYDLECVFFLRMYWERRVQKRPLLRRLLNERRLRLTGSGVTTADSILPRAEALLRDWLLGQEWLRAQMIRQEPEHFYFADSFGASPFLPTLLRAAGFHYAAISRVDGMYFPGCSLPYRFPRPGSSAERLLVKEKSLDFIWRDPNGAQVLCHWNAFTYGQGDMLAYLGITRVYLMRLAMSLHSERHIARRIHGYVKRLAPYSRTRYLLCPIGMDFVEPIPDLVALLNRYNRRFYPYTGIWAVNAGLDDYLSLVDGEREKLPVIELDPNPYWTGFYTARPNLKARCHRTVEKLLYAEKLSLTPDNRDKVPTLRKTLAAPWWKAAVANHHDYITGTSPDRVVELEQLPWLHEAERGADEVIARLKRPERTAHIVKSSLPRWHREEKYLRVETPFYELVWDEVQGGSLVSWREKSTGKELLSGLSLELAAYRDSGGLWRIGYEFAGGIWKEAARASRRRGPLKLRPRDGALEISTTWEFRGERFVRRALVRNDSPVIRLAVEGKAPLGYTVVVRLEMRIRAEEIHMDAPGGVVARPLQKIYRTTFWPLHRFSHLRDGEGGHGIGVFGEFPGAISIDPTGRLELIAVRNAPRERVLGILGIPCNPASGHECEPYSFRFALLPTSEGNWFENGLHRLAWELWGDFDDPARSLFRLSSGDARVVATKPPERGEGVIVRLEAPRPFPHPVQLESLVYPIQRAWLCDARERDLRPLPLKGNAVEVPLEIPIATVRLIFD